MRNKLTLDWIAGFYEGEGSCGSYAKICYRNGKKYTYPNGSLRLTIAQKDKEIIDRIKDYFGYGSVHHQKSGYGEGVWVWSVWYSDAKNTMLLLLPYLQMKRRRDKFLELLEAK